MKDIPDKYTVTVADDKFWNITAGGHVCNGCEIIRQLAARDIQNIDTAKLIEQIPKNDYGDKEFETTLEADVANAGLRRFDFQSFYLREYPCDHWCLKNVRVSDMMMDKMTHITPKIIVTTSGYTLIIRFRCCWQYFYEANIDYDQVKKDGDRA